MKFVPRNGTMHLVGMFDFTSDTYFNRRNRRSKQGRLFASDQNLIFIQSGGKPTAPEGVAVTSNSLFPLTSITHSIFVLPQESIKKNCGRHYEQIHGCSE